MFCQIATYVHRRSLDYPYILLQLVKFRPRRQIRYLSLYITNRLKHGSILVNNVLDKHTQMVYIRIAHTKQSNTNTSAFLR